MFTRASEALGRHWTLHDLRHTGAYRMARDALVPLADIQWSLGHARLSTTQVHLNPVPDDVSAQWWHSMPAGRSRREPGPASRATPGILEAVNLGGCRFIAAQKKYPNELRERAVKMVEPPGDSGDSGCCLAGLGEGGLQAGHGGGDWPAQGQCWARRQAWPFYALNWVGGAGESDLNRVNGGVRCPRHRRR